MSDVRMKTLFLPVRCAAVVCAVITVLSFAREEPAPSSEAEQQESFAANCEEQEEQLNKIRADLQAAEKDRASLKENGRNDVARYERLKANAEEGIKKLEKTIAAKRDVLKERTDLIEKVYEFGDLTREKTDEFLQKGEAAVKSAVRMLNNKSFAVKVEGLAAAEKLSKSCIGLASYRSLLTKYTETVTMAERKWSRTLEMLQKVREKATPANLKKLEAAEEALAARLQKRLAAAGKDYKKDWFVPIPNNMTSTAQACEHARQVRSRLERAEHEEYIGVLPELLTGYWSAVDEAMQMMRQGLYDEADSRLADSEPIRTLQILPAECLPGDMRGALSEQVRNLRSELRARRNSARLLEHNVMRCDTAFDTYLHNVTAEIENMQEDFAAAQEEEKRMAEEEAERRREEEEQADLEADEQEEKLRQSSEHGKKRRKK